MPKTRNYFNAERQMVIEYVQSNIQNRTQWLWVRLGPWPKGHANPLYQVVRPTGDLIYIAENVVHICEFKVEPDPRAIGQLLFYKGLFPDTPEFTAYKRLPIKLIFITTRADQAVEKLAASQGISYRVFCPKWLKEYVRNRYVKSTQ